MRYLFLELRKTKRRGVWLVMAALIVVQFLWAQNVFDSAKTIPQGWLNQLYSMPVLNGILLPTFIAVLVSRLIDMEHKGSAWKLLETMQSKYSLYLGKVLYGAFSVLILGIFQLGSLIYFGIHFGYGDEFDLLMYGRYFLLTVSISFVLFLMQLLISLVFSNQAVGLCIGLSGSMAGLFLMYLPQTLIQKIIPWGLYGATMFVGMDWNPDTRDVKLYYMTQENGAAAFVVAWLLLLLMAGWHAFRNMDTDGYSFGGLKRASHSGSEAEYSDTGVSSVGAASGKKVRIPKMPVEYIKLKRTPIWLAFFILPSISAFIGSANYLNNLGVLQSEWYSLWSQHALFFSYFFLPPLIGVYVSYMWRLEHNGTNWNMVMTHMSPTKLVLNKLCVCAVMASITIVWTFSLYIVSGFICGLSLPLPPELGEWFLCGILGTLAVCSVQIFLSLVIKSFAVPIGIALIGGVAGLVVTNKGLFYMLPYSLLSVGMRANNPYRALDFKEFIISEIVFLIGFNILSILYIKRNDVKTQG